MRRYWWNKPEALRRSPGLRSSRNTKASSPLRLLKKSVGSSQSDLTFYIAVLFLAAGTRSLLAIFEPGSFYFPDSWCYIIVSPNAPCSSGHSPAVTWFWRIGTFGNLTEHSVLLLESVLGVMSALLLFRALRLLSTAKWAMIGACLFAIFPLELFFERAFMAESTETFFVCLFLVTAAESFRSITLVRMAAFSIAASASLGIAAALHDEFLVPALIVWIFMIILQVRQGSRTGAAMTRKLSLVGAATLSLVILVLPSVPIVTDYHNWYGIWTADPIEGALLTFDWAPLVSCTTPPAATDATRAVVHLACAHKKFEYPGSLLNQVYLPSVQSTIHLTPDGKHRFAKTEQQLLGIAQRAIESHPVAFSREIARGVYWQLFRPPSDSLSRYTNAWTSGSASSIFTEADLPSFLNYHEWFSGSVARSNSSPAPGLSRAVSATLRLPQLLLWLAIIGGVWRSIAWLLVSRQKRGRDARDSRQQRSHIPKAFSSRVCLGLLGSMLISTSMFAVAFSSVPGFRYWVPLVPCIIMLLILVVPLPKSDTARDSQLV